MTSRRQSLILLGLGVLAGVGIWVFSPWITGHAEPWDAEAPIWVFSWLGIAILGGLVGRIRGALLPLGYALGQMLITVRSVFPGPFSGIGWMFIGGYAVVAIGVTLTLVGIISGLRWLVYRRVVASDRC